MKRSVVSRLVQRRHARGGGIVKSSTESSLLGASSSCASWWNLNNGWNYHRYQGLGDNQRPFSATSNVIEEEFPSTGSSHVDDLEIEIRSQTKRLLNLKQTPSLDDAMWNEAKSILLWWVEQRKFPKARNRTFTIEAEEEAVVMCFQILDRLANELPKDEHLFASLLDTDLINAVLLNWRNCVIRRHRLDGGGSSRNRHRGQEQTHSSSTTDHQFVTKVPLPSDVAEKVDSYRWCSLVQPNTKTYNLILDGAAMYNRKTGVYFAQSLLEKMVQISAEYTALSSSSSGEVVVVDAITVGSVIKAWVNSGLPDAPHKAQAWLEWLTSRYEQGVHDLRPNNYIYTMVMLTWAQVGDAARAEEILERQLHDFQNNGNISATPDAQTFNTVLFAWSKTRKRREEAPSRAEAILQLMHELSSDDSDTISCRPDHYSLTSVVACWANSNLPGAAEEAESTLQSFLQEAGGGGGGGDEDDSVMSLQPAAQLVAYNTVLRAYAEAGNPQRADDLLQKLVDDYQTGVGQVRPHYISFNQVIAGWSKATKAHLIEKAPHRAEALLAQMQDLHTPGEDGWKTQPDAATYSSVLQCWAMSPHKDAVDNAERILSDMKQEALNHPNRHLEPNVIHYNIVLTAWSRAASKWRDTRAIARSNTLLEDMIKCKVRPNERTFRIILHIIAGSQIRNKSEIANATVQIMNQHGFRPNSHDEKLLKRLFHNNNRNNNNNNNNKDVSSSVTPRRDKAAMRRTQTAAGGQPTTTRK